MNVLILGTVPSPLRSIIEGHDCKCIEHSEPFDVDFLKRNSIDFAVSYKFRHIVKSSIIEHLNGKIINLHISLLPWNRGADPNLWSFQITPLKASAFITLIRDWTPVISSLKRASGLIMTMKP